MIDTFYILDFDRCLADTNKLDAAFLAQIDKQSIGLDTQAIFAARRTAEAQGESFDTAMYVRTILAKRGEEGERDWTTLLDSFTNTTTREDMLLPFAHELIDYLQRMQYRFGIVTYGGRIWQLTKMSAAGLIELPHIVTSVKEKGLLLTSWQQDDGSFLIPSELTGGDALRVKRLVFIDDKPISFTGLPRNVDAFCAITPGVSWPQEVLAGLPSHVTVTDGLKNIIELLISHKDSQVIDKA
ncbi:MAG TPA: hypothetical protein VLG09_04810 [Candidatus Saccharimonadales bacterium]|nr:hypothetical protein [Candidatus Saccharimonadales bacterium]